jgi:hypothetical protein
MKLIKSKKGMALLAVVAIVAIAAVGAYAYFTSTGTGTGAAQTAGSPAGLKITQVGAGYDSLIPNASYHQDQTYAGAGVTKFGNDITLANPGSQRLVSVAVAFRNWGGAITNLPITLSIDSGTSGPLSDTENFSFPAAITLNSHPSTTTVTFNFNSQGAFVHQQFVYGISFAASGDAAGLNVALSSSANNLSVGTDTNPGHVWLSTTNGGLGNDFPACTTTPPVTTGVFESVNTDCGTDNVNNPGAYGTPAQVTAGNADIPAVEVNVVGGVIAALTPGGPSLPVDFAITNPGSSSVRVSTVSTVASSLSGAGTASSEACDTSMYPIAGSPLTINANVAPGTTVFAPSGTSISMTDDGHNQNNCENATVNLTFSSN